MRGQGGSGRRRARAGRRAERCCGREHADRRDARRAAKATKVTLQLKWVTQAQFAGYYAAKAKGYYAAQGLDVTIKVGGPNIVPEQVVAGGQAQFGIDWLSSLMLVARQGHRPRQHRPGVQQERPDADHLEGHGAQHGREDEGQDRRQLAVRQRVRGVRRAGEVRDGSRAQQGRDDLPAAVRHELLPQAADRRGLGDDVQRARPGPRDEEPEDQQALQAERHERDQDAGRRHVDARGRHLHHRQVDQGPGEPGDREEVPRRVVPGLDLLPHPSRRLRQHRPRRTARRSRRATRPGR